MNPYTILGGVLLLVAVAFGGAHVGKKLEREAWQAKEIATLNKHNEAIAAEFKRYERMVKFNNAKTVKAADDHAKEIIAQKSSHDAAVARERAAGGLRIARSACTVKTPGAAASASALKSDGASPATGAFPRPAGEGVQVVDDQTVHDSIRLPETIETDLFNLVEDADKLATQLRNLQKWIRDNALFGPEKE